MRLLEKSVQVQERLKGRSNVKNRNQVIAVAAVVCVLIAAVVVWQRGSGETAHEARPDVEPLAELSPPSGDIILTVKGNIAVHNKGGDAVFDRELLESLGQKVIETTTVWTDGVNRFEGIPLKTLLDRLGAEGDVMEMTALNEYKVHVERKDLVYDPILAGRLNGEALSVREKGPLWLIFPWDQYPDELINEEYHSKAIWQVKEIVVQ